MEITDYASKRLHKHTLPLVMVAAGLFGLALLSAYHYQNRNLSLEARVGKGLVTQVMHTEPKSNGLSKFSFEVEAPTSDQAALPSVDISQVGNNAQRNFNWQ